MVLSTSPIKCIWFRSIKSNFKFWWPSLKVITQLILYGFHFFFHPGGGGYFHQNLMWMCLLDLENLTLSLPIFFAF